MKTGAAAAADRALLAHRAASLPRNRRTLVPAIRCDPLHQSRPLTAKPNQCDLHIASMA